MTKELIERLAKLEHQRWMQQTKYTDKKYDIPVGLEVRWLICWRPYKDLFDDDKEKFREQAEKVLCVLLRFLKTKKDAISTVENILKNELKE